MGLYKLCKHKGRARDRCEHTWWGSFRGHRVSLGKWANCDVHTKAEAHVICERMRQAIRDGTFSRHVVAVETAPVAEGMTFAALADLFKEKYVKARALAASSTINYRLKPLLDFFGNRLVREITTADVEDFMALLKCMWVILPA